MVILNPQSSNAFMTLFFTLSVSAPDKPFNIARLPSLHNRKKW